MTPEEEEQYVLARRLEDANEVRRAIASLCLSIIAAIWAFSDKSRIHFVWSAKWAFVLAVAAVLCVVVNRLLRIRHWTAVIDDKSRKTGIEASETLSGRLSDKAFWLALFLAGCAFVLFVITLLT